MKRGGDNLGRKARSWLNRLSVSHKPEILMKALGGDTRGRMNECYLPRPRSVLKGGREKLAGMSKYLDQLERISP